LSGGGPAPYLFVAMTPEESEDLKEAARGLIYWGEVPVHVAIGGTEFTTALFPWDCAMRRCAVLLDA
jgi:hypothetical protein